MEDADAEFEAVWADATAFPRSIFPPRSFGEIGGIPSEANCIDCSGMRIKSWDGLTRETFPEGTSYLDLGWNSIESWEGLEAGMLPANLEVLGLRWNDIKSWEGLVPGALPDSLKYICMTDMPKPIEGMWLPPLLLEDSEFSRFIPYVGRTLTRIKMKDMLDDICMAAENMMLHSSVDGMRGWHTSEFLIEGDEVYKELISCDGR